MAEAGYCTLFKSTHGETGREGGGEGGGESTQVSGYNFCSVAKEKEKKKAKSVVE